MQLNKLDEIIGSRAQHCEHQPEHQRVNSRMIPLSWGRISYWERFREPGTANLGKFALRQDMAETAMAARQAGHTETTNG